MSYALWNDALAKRFFHTGVAHRQVYLYVTEEVIESVGRSFGGGGVAEFVAAVRTGPPQATRSGLCQQALQVADGWRRRSLPFPPYIAYLALFVLAGGHEGDFAPHAYYPRLWELLGEPVQGMPPSFDRMIDLWEDLERWSTEDRDGELGVFEARIVGGWIHVGLPLAQTILTEAERGALPVIFADAGLEPGKPPSHRELNHALLRHGRAALRPRTMTALERGREAFVRALLDVVADDYQEWHGSFPAPTGSRSAVNAALRLCLAVDRTAGRVSATVRCHSVRDIPEDGLQLSGGGTELECAQYLPQWSAPLRWSGRYEAYEPADRVWSAGLRLSDRDAGWTVCLRPARARVFAGGAAEGLPGLVEVANVPLRQQFYIALPTSDLRRIHEWLERACDSWERLPITRGMPHDWTLVVVAAASTDDGLRNLDASVAVPDRVSIRTVGGVRTSLRGNSFFVFAPPRIAVDGADAGDRVYCADRLLERDSGGPDAYSLPDDLRPDTRIVVRVMRGTLTLRRLSLHLVSGVPWRFDGPLAHSDRFGNPTQNRAERGAGAIFGAMVPTPCRQLPADLLRTPGLEHVERRIFVIGRCEGDIAVWPSEPFPEWQAIWMIPIRRRGRAIFCGSSASQAQPSPVRRADRRKMALWRRVLWHWRKRITPPQDQELAALWLEYQRAAREA